MWLVLLGCSTIATGPVEVSLADYPRSDWLEAHGLWVAAGHVHTRTSEGLAVHVLPESVDWESLTLELDSCTHTRPAAIASEVSGVQRWNVAPNRAWVRPTPSTLLQEYDEQQTDLTDVLRSAGVHRFRLGFGDMESALVASSVGMFRLSWDGTLSRLPWSLPLQNPTGTRGWWTAHVVEHQGALWLLQDQRLIVVSPDGLPYALRDEGGLTPYGSIDPLIGDGQVIVGPDGLVFDANAKQRLGGVAALVAAGAGTFVVSDGLVHSSDDGISWRQGGRFSVETPHGTQNAVAFGAAWCGGNLWTLTSHGLFNGSGTQKEVRQVRPGEWTSGGDIACLNGDQLTWSEGARVFTAIAGSDGLVSTESLMDVPSERIVSGPADAVGFAEVGEAVLWSSSTGDVETLCSVAPLQRLARSPAAVIAFEPETDRVFYSCDGLTVDAEPKHPCGPVSVRRADATSPELTDLAVQDGVLLIAGRSGMAGVDLTSCNATRDGVFAQ